MLLLLLLLLLLVLLCLLVCLLLLFWLKRMNTEFRNSRLSTPAP